MTKLIQTLQLRYKWNNLFLFIAVLEALSIFLSITAEQKGFFIFISAANFLFLCLRWKLLLLTGTLLFLIMLVFWLTKQNGDFPENISGDFKVQKVISMGAIIQVNKNNILVQTKENINMYDLINVQGRAVDVQNTSDFDLKTYLKGLNTFKTINWPKLSIVARTNDLRVRLRGYVSTGGDWYKQITPLLFLGFKTEATKEIYDMSLKMSVVHLFVISGFHISIFYMVVNKILRLLRVNPKLGAWLPLIPIWIYLFLLGFPTSALRASLFTTMLVINREILKSKFSSIEVLGFVIGLMTIIDPMSIYSLSFILTFIATSIIVFVNNIKFKNKKIKYFSVMFSVYASNVFIIMYVNRGLAVLGILFSALLTPIFAFMYIATMFLFPIKPLLNYIDYVFVWVLKAFERLNVVVSTPSFSIGATYSIYGFIWGSFIMFNIWNYSMAKKIT